MELVGVSSESPLEGRCAARTRDGGFCEKYPVVGGSRCRFHGGASSGAPEGNGNAEKHGLHSDTGKYYRRLDRKGRKYIERVYLEFLRDAPFEGDEEGKAAVLWEVAVNLHKRRRADGWLAGEGLLREDVIEVDGVEVGRDVEPHPVHMVYDRLARSDIRRLKELGVLNDPGGCVGEGLESLAEVLSEDKSREGGR